MKWKVVISFAIVDSVRFCVPVKAIISWCGPMNAISWMGAPSCARRRVTTTLNAINSAT